MQPVRLIVFSYFMKNSSYSPRGVMDNTEDSGSSAGGSIPSEGAKNSAINVDITMFSFI